MLKLSEIKDLIKLIDQTSVNELEIENEGSRICIRKHKPELSVAAPVVVSAAAAPSAAVQPAAAHPPAPAEAVAQTDSNLHTIVSPMVGTFYSAPAPDAAPFVKVGDRVGEKSIVCIVEAMKLMNEIEADIAGEITQVLVENGQLVEFGQPLFHVRKG